MRRDADGREQLQRLVRTAARATGVDGAFIAVIEGDQLRILATHDLPKAPVGAELPFGQSLCSHVLSKDAMSTGVLRELDLLGAKRAIGWGFARYAGIPMRFPSGATGGALVVLSRGEAPLSVGDLAALEDLAPLAEQALFGPARERERSAEMAMIRQSSEATRAQNEQLSAIIDNAPVAILVLERGDVVRSWNPAAEKIFGWTAKEALGGPLPFLSAEDRDGAAARFASVLEGGSIDSLELSRVRRDGRRVDTLITAMPLRDADRNPEAALVMAMDVSERKRAIEQLLTSQKLDAIGRLAGGVAHDFNNLLGVIRGYADLLYEDLGADDPRATDVEHIRDASDRGSALTRQLLTFSRKQVLEPQIVDLNTIVLAMFQLLQRIIGEDIELSLALAPGLSSIRVDPSQMEQVLLNLAANARDAMPDGGKLHITTCITDRESDPQPPAWVNGSVLLSVTDSGRGMDEATRNRVFEPFFTTKSFSAGTGLGLATVYGIIEQSDGRIIVDSEIGRGTTFKLFFPIVTGKPEAKPLDFPLSTPRQGSGTILVVEDEPYLRAVAVRVLRNKGYHVLEAACGPDALKVAEEWDGEIHALITDLIMPGMNGRDLARKIVETHPDTRVLFISGYTQDIIAEEGVLPPGTAFVGKPFTPRMLLAKLRELLEPTEKKER